MVTYSIVLLGPLGQKSSVGARKFVAVWHGLVPNGFADCNYRDTQLQALSTCSTLSCTIVMDKDDTASSPP